MEKETEMEITPENLKEYFETNYSYIDFCMTENEIQEYLSRPYIQGKTFLQIVDLLYDYLISSGAEVIE